MAAQQEGKVKSVLSGDTLILTNNARQERTISLAFINAPRLQSDEPHSFESRDFLRKLCVGKVIRFQIIYAIPQKTGGASREYGVVTLPDGTQLPDLIVQEGHAKLRDDADRKAESPPAAELLEKLQALEAHARADEKGVWAAKTTIIENTREIPDAKAFAEEYKGKAIESIVERVLSGDRLIVRLMVSPTKHVQTTVLIAGLRSPTTARTNPSDGSTQPAEPFGNESQAFVEDRLLQRGVQVRLLGVSPNNILVGEVRHPVGNIGEFLLKAGLARCVDHHSTWLGAEMGKLRQAERSAKEAHLGLFKSHVAAKTGGSESEATVSRVFSADTLFVRQKNGAEKRINLSSVRQPKPTDPKQSPFGAEAKEFLRKRLIGKHVKVTIDGKRPATEGYDEREMATVSQNGKNVALMLVENGYASVIRHRMDDTDRSPIYDDLLAAEVTAQAEGKGMWNPKPPKQQAFVDYSESLEKAKRQLTLLSKSKKVPAVVDFVKSGSRFTVLIPRDNSKLTLVLGGIRAPRSARGPQDAGEPFGQEAHDFAVKRCMQRDVEIDVDDTDKQGGFIGTLFVNRENFAKLLVEEGLATVHAYSAEKSGNGAELFAAEQKAKEARRGLWHDWDPSQEAAADGADYDAPTNGTNGANGDAPLPTRERNYKDVTVTYVDPSNGRLKLQMIGSGKANLDTLMKELASFHLAPGNGQKLSAPPKAGDVVSAKFSEDGVWYRARVRRNDRENKTSEVVYIDYGNAETQKWDDLRPLDAAKFGPSRLKGQAVDAALSFLQFPTASEYLSESVNALYDMTGGRELVANIDFTDSRENLLWVTLMDPKAASVSNSVNADIAAEGLAMVPKKLRPFERAAPEIIADLKEKEAEAKAERRGMWEYGDLTED
ncbi:probable transcriptional coactivator p100 [Ramularia collo-cygni]|uniref:Probable endonuclease LCL3 n=1 Tax=Ramularia collo-cygni TaxID=112498 RepID=A0A2D3VA34_9PEZI|nr:probable transcriptional coactivator p100 [Ramularia collo-cygni]CZT24913.1 probable transcriptional coactivator p100 [Ramularia collo-cygni]